MAKNSIWMKLYIGDYQADTRSLTTEEHGAYLLLLMTYYRTGPLPNDADKLARITGLTRRRWDGMAETIRAFFTVGEDGLLHNKRADAELEKNRASAESNSIKAEKAAKARWNVDAPRTESAMLQASANPRMPDAPSMVSQKLEVRSHKEQVQELFPSSDEKGKKASLKKVPDPRHTQFKEAFERYFVEHNQGVSGAPWSGQEAAQLSKFLTENPTFALDQWQRVLLHRSRSPVTHGKKLSQWIAHALSFYAGPANDYGSTTQPKGAGTYGSNVTRNGSTSEQQVIDAGRSLLDARERARCAPVEHHLGGPVIEAGHPDPQSTGAQHYPGSAY